MATTAAPDGVILDGVILDVVPGADGSPSQERLVRIAAMLRDAEQALPVAAAARTDEVGSGGQRASVAPPEPARAAGSGTAGVAGPAGERASYRRPRA